MTTRRRQVSFRLTLLTLVVGLLVCTVVTIAVVGAVTSARSVRELEDRYFDATATAVGSEVRAFFEPAVSVLADTQGLARQGRFTFADGEDLGRYFGERLKHLATVAWLSFSEDASGRFVGVWRREDGARILNRSDPAVRDGMPEEFELADDGSLRPYQRELKGGYDPRQAEWYRRAAAAKGPIFTEPFLFNEGRPGMTCAVAFRDSPDAAPRGVLTADFFLEDLSRFLRSLARDPGTSVHVLTRSGGAVASSVAADSAEARVLKEALATAPASLATIAPDHPVTWTFEHEGGPQVAALGVARVGGSEWVTATIVPEDRFLAGVHGNRRVAILLGAAVIALSLLLGWLLAHRVAEPLRGIAEDLEHVARFHLESRGASRSRIREISVVADSAERMKASLRSFGRYVPTELVQELLAQGVEARLGGSHRALTVWFSDIEGFTRIAEGMEPARLVEHLGEYLQEMTAILRAHGGTIDKFMGDGIMAFFNAPRDLEDHAAAACRAAVACRRRLTELGERWRSEGKPILRARVGLHTGTVLVGNIGAPARFAYTVMGDVVNLASRLESLNKRYGTWILASDAVRQAAGEGFAWRRVDRVTVVGRHAATDVFELLETEADPAPDPEPARAAYEAGFRRYLARDFAEARERFLAAAAASPSDRAAPLLVQRCEELLRSPPPENWNGSDVLTEK